MRAKLLTLIVGMVLTAVVIFGVQTLRAQSTFDGPKWEYIWVGTDTTIVDIPLKGFDLNSKRVDFTGNTYELFTALGNEGWEYADTIGAFWLFRRPAAS